MLPVRGIVCLLMSAVWATQYCAVAAVPIHGDIKVLPQYATADDDSVEASLGETYIRAPALTVRLTGVYTRDELEVGAHYLLTGMRGNAVELRNQLQAAFPQLDNEQRKTQCLHDKRSAKLCNPDSSLFPNHQ